MTSYFTPGQMRLIRFAFWMALAATVASTASAQDCFGPSGYGWPYLGTSQSPNSLDYIPYFSAHPPVYYSAPVPRTYGYSPYAYPPGTRTPEIEVIRPQVMINPFVPRKEGAAPAEEVKTAVRKPKRITNHFVKSDRDA